MWIYHWFGKHRGWTPKQVDELSLDQQFWLPVLKDADDEAMAALNTD
jgi:hypothetical protein